MLCPRCDEQGEIVKAQIIATGEVVQICNECDALWPAGTQVGPTGFVDFSTYVRPLGLRGLWDELTLLRTGDG